MFKKYANTLLLLMLGLPVATVSATPGFNVDTLFKASDIDGNGYFTVSNHSGETLYLDSEILKVEVVEHELTKTLFDKDNFMLWDLSVSPTKAVLQPYESKEFSIKYLCERNCDRKKDLIYQVRFFPANDVENADAQVVSFVFSMAPYYVIPSKDQKVDYTWNYNKAKRVIDIENTGNTFIKVELNQCDSQVDKEKQCSFIYYVLSDRIKSIKLPEHFIANQVQVKVANHDQSIQKAFFL